ncbi:hypothetical protein IHV12_20235 [Fictibacillus sp. 7GRE50]|uniref:helix-turn-helix domain-containing protein n=1 Tax=Fictibacillus sp. 7GRE50 TaxID=2745878 RepID=UPI0018CD0868|nr:helix-turn-helix domain-containing protein [Fictibacillus sp. 7GRE50]MBH0167256.1 hypothetical protein [Fictibacillus sp. 7GRE50]
MGITTDNRQGIIEFRGTVYDNGYGLIPQKVMRDDNINATAKLIYAYLCSFAGKVPEEEIMFKELGITDSTFYKHLKQLIEIGYVSISKIEGPNSFDKVYFIEAIPEVAANKAIKLLTKNTIESDTLSQRTHQHNAKSSNDTSKTMNTKNISLAREQNKAIQNGFRGLVENVEKHYLLPIEIRSLLYHHAEKVEYLIKTEQFSLSLLQSNISTYTRLFSLEVLYAALNAALKQDGLPVLNVFVAQLEDFKMEEELSGKNQLPNEIDQLDLPNELKKALYNLLIELEYKEKNRYLLIYRSLKLINQIYLDKKPSKDAFKKALHYLAIDPQVSHVKSHFERNLREYDTQSYRNTYQDRSYFRKNNNNVTQWKDRSIDLSQFDDIDPDDLL